MITPDATTTARSSRRARPFTGDASARYTKLPITPATPTCFDSPAATSAAPNDSFSGHEGAADRSTRARTRQTTISRLATRASGKAPAAIRSKVW